MGQKGQKKLKTLEKKKYKQTEEKRQSQGKRLQRSNKRRKKTRVREQGMRTWGAKTATF